MVNLTDIQINDQITREQKRLEDSGLSSLRVRVKNTNVKNAISRLYNLDSSMSGEIDFNLFARAIRDLGRLGMFKAVEGALR